MPVQYAIPVSPVIQYDGTNSAEIAGMYQGFDSTSAEIKSEGGGTLSLEITYWEGGGSEAGVGTPYVTPLTVETGDWVFVQSSPSVITAAQFAEHWTLKP